jgi:hypothetical protein
MYFIREKNGKLIEKKTGSEMVFMVYNLTGIFNIE